MGFFRQLTGTTKKQEALRQQARELQQPATPEEPVDEAAAAEEEQNRRRRLLAGLNQGVATSPLGIQGGAEQVGRSRLLGV